MRVLQIHKWHHVASGADRAYFATTAVLEKYGHEVANFATAHPKNVLSPWLKYFPKYHEYGHFNLEALWHLSSFFWNFEAARKLEQLILDFKPAVAHLHNIYHHLTPSILRVLKKYKIPVVMTVHDFNLLNPNYVCFHDGAVCQHGSYRNPWPALAHNCLRHSLSVTFLNVFKIFLERIFRWHEKNIDLFIFGSQFYLEKFRSAGFKYKKGAVQHQFLLVEDYKQTLESKAGNFAFAGRLSEEKGVFVLLESLKLIQTKGWHIIFVGDGPLKSIIEKSGYQVMGSLSKQERELLLDEQQFIVAPSVCWENLSFGILEAAGLHRPVIATKIGGIPEMIDDGVTGLLVEPNNPKLLAEAIDTMLQNSHQTKTMGERAFQRAQEKYNEQIFYERLIALYGDLLA